jgi:hypothetical protein
VRPDVYTAPTWSWASVTCPVIASEASLFWGEYPEPNKIINIKEVKIQTLDRDEMGSVVGGYLRLIAMLVPGTIEQDSKATSEFFPWGQNSQGEENATWVRLDDPTSETTGTYYYVPFVPSFRHPMGLVLKHVDGCTGRFERVGTFHIDEQRVGFERRRPESISTKSATEERNRIISEELYEEYDEETDRYTFTIV